MNKLKDFKNAEDRRKYLETVTNTKINHISNFSFPEEQVQNHNIENLIGVAQTPLGIAGPLKINGSYANGDFYLPLATTEGALVASISRGCKAISLSGGTEVIVENAGVTRAPVFKTKGINESKKFIAFVEKNFLMIKKIAETTSSHLKLLHLNPYMAGNNVWLRFSFATGDAMGMNMATIATEKIVKEFIEAQTKVKCISLSGNLCVDKKPSWLNFLEGRGKKVWVEAIIKKDIVAEILKTTSDKIDEVVRRKILYGGIISGSLGFNAHAANILAAIFLATGQDLSHVVEGSMAVTTTEITAGDLQISCYLPDLMIGTVGGGTGLPTQKESLSILGIPDPKLKTGEQVLKLAEIIASAVLAGELSLLAALANGDLAIAHEKLGRSKK